MVYAIEAINIFLVIHYWDIYIRESPKYKSEGMNGLYWFDLLIPRWIMIARGWPRVLSITRWKQSVSSILYSTDRGRSYDFYFFIYSFIFKYKFSISYSINCNLNLTYLLQNSMYIRGSIINNLFSLAPCILFYLS